MNKIPCLFPSVSQLVANEEQDYSFFFNSGLLLDFDIVASHILQRQEDKIALIGCRTDAPEIQELLIRAAKTAGLKARAKRLDCQRDLNEQTNDNNQSNWFILSDSEQLTEFAAGIPNKNIYVSSALNPSVLSDGYSSQASNVFVIHSRLLPGKFDSAMQRFKIWARTRRLSISHERLQAEAYFACIALNDGMGHIKRYLVKDFLLDSLDHAEGLPLYMPLYPQPSIGPGQRFLSKGGYIIPVTNGKLSLKQAQWILP